MQWRIVLKWHCTKVFSFRTPKIENLSLKPRPQSIVNLAWQQVNHGHRYDSLEWNYFTVHDRTIGQKVNQKRRLKRLQNQRQLISVILTSLSPRISCMVGTLLFNWCICLSGPGLCQKYETDRNRRRSKNRTVIWSKQNIESWCDRNTGIVTENPRGLVLVFLFLFWETAVGRRQCNMCSVLFFNWFSSEITGIWQ